MPIAKARQVAALSPWAVYRCTRDGCAGLMFLQGDAPRYACAVCGTSYDAVPVKTIAWLTPIAMTMGCSCFAHMPPEQKRGWRTAVAQQNMSGYDVRRALWCSVWHDWVAYDGVMLMGWAESYLAAERLWFRGIAHAHSTQCYDVRRALAKTSAYEPEDYPCICVPKESLR